MFDELEVRRNYDFQSFRWRLSFDSIMRTGLSDEERVNFLRPKRNRY